MLDYGIMRPGPITPYLEGETVKDCDFCLDGSRLRDLTGFKYNVPEVKEQHLRDIIESYRRMNWWPPLDPKPIPMGTETVITAGRK